MERVDHARRAEGGRVLQEGVRLDLRARTPATCPTPSSKLDGNSIAGAMNPPMPGIPPVWRIYFSVTTPTRPSRRRRRSARRCSRARWIMPARPVRGARRSAGRDVQRHNHGDAVANPHYPCARDTFEQSAISLPPGPLWAPRGSRALTLGSDLGAAGPGDSPQASSAEQGVSSCPFDYSLPPRSRAPSRYATSLIPAKVRTRSSVSSTTSSVRSPVRGRSNRVLVRGAARRRRHRELRRARLRARRRNA